MMTAQRKPYSVEKLEPPQPALFVADDEREVLLEAADAEARVVAEATPRTHCGFECECRSRFYHDVQLLVSEYDAASPCLNTANAVIGRLRGLLEEHE